MWGVWRQHPRDVAGGAGSRDEHCMNRPGHYPQLSAGLLQDRGTGGVVSPEGGVRTLGSQWDKCQLNTQKEFS